MTDPVPLTDEELARMADITAAIPDSATGWMLLYREAVVLLIADLRASRARVKELEEWLTSEGYHLD